MTDLAAIRERHQPTLTDPPYCACDGQLWDEAGCDTAQVLAALVESQNDLGEVWDAIYNSGSEGPVRAALADAGSATE